MQFTIRSLMITVMVVAGLLSLLHPWHELSPFLIFVGLPLGASSVAIVVFVLMSEFLVWCVSR